MDECPSLSDIENRDKEKTGMCNYGVRIPSCHITTYYIIRHYSLPSLPVQNNKADNLDLCK